MKTGAVGTISTGGAAGAGQPAAEQGRASEGGSRSLASGAPPQPRLLDRVRSAARARHYSPRTEKAYVAWIKRFIFFHRLRHPEQMGEGEVTEFLTSLATRNRVSASTQNQALSALLFLYGVVLGRELKWLHGVVRAKRPVRLPVVLSRQDVGAILRPGSWLPSCMGRACA